jgi:hypothetical protein
VVQLLGKFNNIAFLHDLTSRPGFTTGWFHLKALQIKKDITGQKDGESSKINVLFNYICEIFCTCNFRRRNVCMDVVSEVWYHHYLTEEDILLVSFPGISHVPSCLHLQISF